MNTVLMRVVACRSCGAGMVWAVTSHGKAMPVDHKPAPQGEFRLRTLPDEPAPLAEWVPWSQRMPGDELYKSHFATCPNANEHRKRPAAATRGGQ